LLAAASPPQEKAERSGKRGFGGGSPRHTTEPSDYRTKPFAGEAERSGKRGNAQRSTKHCQCSNDLKRFTRCARLHLLSAQRTYGAQRHTAPSASLRTALHCAQRCTVRSILHPPLQSCTARSIAQRPALHCTEHSEPRQGRSQQANQAYTSGGIFQSAFNGCCAQTVRVRVSLANSRTRALLFFRGSLTACDMDLCIL
jgi:hypothetical protein